MKNTVFGNEKRPVLTIVMDGVGYTPNKVGNAVAAADTPTLDMLWEKYPHVLVKSAYSFTIGLQLIFLFVLLFIFCLVLVASVMLKAFSRAIELSNALSERESKKIKNDTIANRIMVTA